MKAYTLKITFFLLLLCLIGETVWAQESDIKSLPSYKNHSLASTGFLKQLKKNIKYPKQKEDTQSLKDIILTMTVARDGKFENLKIEESCGNETLDQSVITAINRMSELKSKHISPAYNSSGEPVDFTMSIEIPASCLSKSGGYDPKNDAIRREMWLQRLKDKGRWVYNPATDRDNVPVSPTMYPDYYN